MKVSAYKHHYIGISRETSDFPPDLRKLLRFRHMLMIIASAGDRNLQERIVNVVTSIPFIVLGFRVPRSSTYFDFKLPS